MMSDITSGYNVAKNIYFEPEFNSLCGFTQQEVEAVVINIAESCGFEEKESKVKEAVDLMKTYYNGYRFSHTINEYIYNPTLCIYF